MFIGTIGTIGRVAATAAGTGPDAMFRTISRPGTGAAATQNVGFAPSFVAIKNRSTGGHNWYDIDNGPNKYLQPNGAQAPISTSDALNAFTSTGYSLGADATARRVNASGSTYVDWVFADYPGFFKRGVITTSGTSTATIDLSSLGTIGMLAVKKVDTTSNWIVFHRSADTGKLLLFNSTLGQSADNTLTVSGTTASFTFGETGTFEYYAFAHNPAGNIQCGAVPAANGVTNVNLGWDVQWLLTKPDASAPWLVNDTARGFDASGGPTISLNSTGAEAASTNAKTISGGFSYNAGTTLTFFCAIRKP